MGFLRWITGSGLRVALFIAGIFLLYHLGNEIRVLSGGPLNVLQRLELTALDAKFSFRGNQPPDRWRVAIAAIDEKAIEKYGPPPWDRSIHARLVNRLTDGGASSVAFDMTFEQPAKNLELEVTKRIKDQLDDGRPVKFAIRTLKRVQQVSTRLSNRALKLRPRRAAQGLAEGIERFAETHASIENELSTWTSSMDAVTLPEDSDERFAAALRRSGKVVLGVQLLSRNEARSMGETEKSVAQTLSRVSSSTIAEVVSDLPSGLMEPRSSREAFESGIYRRFWGLRPPTSALAAATPHFASLNATPDPDGVNRRMPLMCVIKGSGIALPTLALKAVEVATDESLEVVTAPGEAEAIGVRMGDRAIETELAAAITLDWYGADAQLPVFSIADLVDGKVDDADIRDRIFFVAATAAGTHDQRVTPLNPLVPGVLIHATLAQNLLDGRHLRRPFYVVFLELGFILVVGLLSGLIMARFRVAGQVVTAIGLAGAWILVDRQVFFAQGLVVSTLLPLIQITGTLLAMTVWSFLVEQRERRKTKTAFGRYLSPKVMEHVLSKPEEYLRLGGRRYEATVLFSDIRGFTTISESLTPEALGLLLNRYMTPMTNIVFEFDGTLDKYIGDAVMAFWGAPVERSDHALLACQAALRMIEVVDELNVELEKDDLPQIAIGIGLSTGPMTIGNMGSDDFFAYTALGDRVNLGARLEGQTKEYGVQILISEATYSVVQEDMLCRELGSLRVKGKRKPVRIYELMGTRTEVASLEPFVKAFHDGLTFFRDRRWDEATAQFQRARALAGVRGDKSSDLYIQWCQEYKEKPPEPDWDGVRIATSK